MEPIYSLTFIHGVTFLAFGNGAPDIFSAIAAIGNAKNGDAGLAIGALFGKTRQHSGYKNIRSLVRYLNTFLVCIESKSFHPLGSQAY